MNIGLLGGTFNPIHNAHLRIAEAARDRLGLDKILFIPAATPPHKELDGEISFKHRCSMVALAIADNPHFAVSDIEQQRGGRSYTVDTLFELKNLYPDDQLYFIIGSDSFLDIASWYKVVEIFNLCNIVVIERPEALIADPISPLPVAIRSEFCYVHEELRLTHRSGFSVFFVPDTQLDISSSSLRSMIRENKSTRYLLPDSVAKYISEKRIYLK
ncbi:MAG: nicotinate (nicotinamide) nucleotide adenylyltransferase [Geobacteraceae bacterium]|nr:nicotinate (nicotinamide) nucleotide adenylyltransferase [Geobacteraceae bacterium]